MTAINEFTPSSVNVIQNIAVEEKDHLYSSYCIELPVNINAVSIVIPAYNEAKRIASTIKDIEENFQEVNEIIVVFDGSDNTPAVAKSISKKVKIVTSKRRLGHGGAVFKGINEAKGDVICVIDADGAIPAIEVRRLSFLVNDNNPAIFGSRWVRNSVVLRKEPLRNRLGGRVYHYLSYAVLGIKIKDSFCGLKVFKRHLAISLKNRIIIKDRTFNIAIAYHLKLLGIDPLEVGIRWEHKDGSQLPVGFRTIAIMFITLIGLRISHSSRFKRGQRIAEKLRANFDFF